MHATHYLGITLHANAGDQQGTLVSPHYVCTIPSIQVMNDLCLIGHLLVHVVIYLPERLSVDDLGDVQRKIFAVKTEWYNLGLELGLRPPTLDSICNKHSGDPSQCFRQVLQEWLKGVNPPPTWQAMVNALKSPTVAEYQVAEQIQTELSMQPLTPHQQHLSLQPPSTSAQPHPKSLGLCFNFPNCYAFTWLEWEQLISNFQQYNI